MTVITPIVGPDVVAAIDAQHDLMRHAYETADAALLADRFFVADGWTVGGDEMTWRGREALIRLYRDIVGKYRWQNRREALISLSETAVLEILIGTTVAVDPADESHSYKIQLTWQRIDDVWMCISQFFAPGSTFDPKLDD